MTIIKRRYAVMLEDAIEVPTPSAQELAQYDDDITVWAKERFDDLYGEIVVAADWRSILEGHPEADRGRVLWENEFHADLDFPEGNYEVQVVE